MRVKYPAPTQYNPPDPFPTLQCRSYFDPLTTAYGRLDLRRCKLIRDPSNPITSLHM